jgi:replicative DNA helicase
MQDVAAEKAVLAGIWRYGDEAYYDVCDITTDEEFTVEINKKLFKCFAQAIESNDISRFDLPTVLSLGHVLGFDFDTAAAASHIRAIANCEIERANVRKAARQIKKLSLVRNFDSILACAERPIFEFGNQIYGSSDDVSHVGEGLREYVDYLIKNPVKQIGLSSGFPRWDYSIGGGMRRGTVNLVGARTKVGKSIFAINVGLHVAGKSGFPVLYLDREMMKVDQQVRKLACLSGVPIEEIECGGFGRYNDKIKKVNDAVTILEEMPYTYAKISGMSMEEVLSIARRWIFKDVGLNSNGEANDCLLVFDYFQLMATAELKYKNLQKHDVLGILIINLANLCKQYGIPCLCLGQLNRDGAEREDTSVLGGSDQIAHTVSNFTILKPKSTDELAEDLQNGVKGGNMKLVQIMTRHGKGLPFGDYINVDGYKDCAQMTEGKTKLELYDGDKGFEIDTSKAVSL